MTLGGQIKQAREKLQLSQSAAAREWGLNLNTLKKWELDKACPRSLGMARLSDVLTATAPSVRSPLQNAESSSPTPIGTSSSTSGKQRVRGQNRATLYLGEAASILARLPTASVDCIVTSPPYYGQRDYGVAEQLGLETDPLVYVERLRVIFEAAARVLKPSGSLWVNLGDTYWSGRGAPCGPDKKNRHRRFLRPQDRRGPHPWCKAKQLLLLPHRVAIALQDSGWILRNDNVWSKQSPTPDPVKDRCASAHEYFFHFVRSRFYHFDFDRVSEPCVEPDMKKAPSSVWSLANRPNFKKHAAVFPPSLVALPILATLPKKGTILDPFCGSGTALEFALKLDSTCSAIGIDVSQTALQEAAERLACRITIPAEFTEEM